MNINTSLTLLYAEDHEVIREQTTQLLKIFFGKIHTVSNGKEAKEVFDSHEIDIVITDIIMPEIDGLELASYIKSKKPHVPILIATAFSDPKYFMEAIQLGVEGYLIKPLKLEQFKSQIEKTTHNVLIQKENSYLQNTLNQYKQIVDENIIVSKTDLKGIITYANEMFCKISKYSEDELLGKSHNIIRHPDMPKEVFADLWDTIKNKKQSWHGKVKNRAKDGSYYIVQTTVKPIIDDSGNITEFIALRDDITELEDLKESLKSQRDDVSNQLSEYSKAIDNATILSRTNLQGIITYANQKFSDISGYTKEELEGSPHSIVKHPDTQQSTFKDMWDTITCGKIWNGVLKNKRKSGEKYWVKCSIFPIFSKEGKIIEYMSIRQDISKTIQLHMELESTQRDILYRMGDIAEKRSEETGLHVKRVAEYSKLLALIYGLSEDDVNIIYLASPMHDIGKVAISDDILKKQGKLTTKEFEIMKTHSKVGYELLKGSSRAILQNAAIIAKEHHEKWDGSGYPEGKKGKEIHIFGRITAIADVFDALGSDRHYKKAWEIEDILTYFKDQSGKHFDPELITLFFKHLDRFIEIRNRYQDTIDKL